MLLGVIAHRKRGRRSNDWSNALSMQTKCHVFVDFDGTISPLDTTDLLLERFADPRWRDIEEDWKAGRIGSRECMGRQIDLVRASPEQLDAFIADIEIDPEFPGFVRRCRVLGHSVTVMSDGLDRSVASSLRRADLDLPFHANRLEWIGGDRWRLTFPYARSGCRSLAGNCKCQLAESERRRARIVIGDGRSDFCISGWADLVLAKGALMAHCGQEGIPYIAFSEFAEASELIAGWLAAHGNEPATPATYMGER
jgi:2-hydroxy-3-keto-5-methylthiopentenyl-1-phosphate phosphatase